MPEPLAEVVNRLWKESMAREKRERMRKSILIRDHLADGSICWRLLCHVFDKECRDLLLRLCHQEGLEARTADLSDRLVYIPECQTDYQI